MTLQAVRLVRLIHVASQPNGSRSFQMTTEKQVLVLVLVLVQKRSDMIPLCEHSWSIVN